MWNIDDNKLIFEALQTIVCESNAQLQKMVFQLKNYFKKIKFSNSDNVCIKIDDYGVLQIMELSDLKDNIKLHIQSVVKDSDGHYTYDISFTPFFKLHFKYDNGYIDESYYYFIVKTSKGADKLFDYIVQNSLVKDTTKLNELINNIEIYNVFDYSNSTIKFLRRGINAIRAAALSGNMHRNYNISDDDILELFD